eukprot:scpid99143/ scgid9184/ 
MIFFRSPIVSEVLHFTRTFFPRRSLHVNSIIGILTCHTLRQYNSEGSTEFSFTQGLKTTEYCYKKNLLMMNKTMFTDELQTQTQCSQSMTDSVRVCFLFVEKMKMKRQLENSLTKKMNGIREPYTYV